MKRVLFSVVACGFAVASARFAAADPAALNLTMPAVATSRPLFVPGLLLARPAEPSGSGDLAAAVALEPLRLSLLSTITPVAGAYPQCATREDAAGNSDHGVPIQRSVFVAVAPHLVLHGFSSAGCPIDGGLGAGVTYAAPLAPSLWLAAGAGFHGIPGRPPVLPARTAAEVRVDVVKQTKDGSTFRIGVERKSGTGVQGVPAMVTVGGGF